MAGKEDIEPLSITDGKISNQANISFKKLAKATEGQILVAQSDGRFAAATLSGDVTLNADGATSVTSTSRATTTDGTGTTTVVTGPQGPSGAQGATGPQGEQGPAGSDATVTTSAVDSAGAVMETDLIQTSAGAGDANKPVKLDATGKIDASMIDGNDVSYNDISNKPASFTPSGHDHTLSDITDAGTAAAAATGDFAAAGHDHDDDYLGIVAKAADSDKLDGNDSSAFALTVHNHDHDALINYDVEEHRVINDGGTSTTELWSAHNINYHLSGKADSGHNHDGIYSGVSHTHNEANTVSAGFMPASDKLFVNNLSNKVSVQTTGPFTGFIGINDTSPGYQLDVNGTARFTMAVTFGGYTFPVFDGDAGKALVTNGSGSLSFSNIAVANVTGLGDSATKDVGTGSTNVAAGNHTHSTGNNGFVPSAGSSGQFLAHNGAFAAVAATNVTGLGDAATRDVGIGSGEVSAGNHTHSAATTSAAGFLSTTDKTKLDSYPSTNSTHNDEFLRKDGTFQSVPAAVSKKEITIEWGTDYSSNSVIDNITSGGSWTADAVTIRLYHNFGTEHIIVSVLDKDNAFGKGNNSQLDLNIQNNDDATVFINSSNSCDIKFNYVDNSISTNDTFKITIVG